MFYSRKLKKFNKIKHCFFSRKGGFSKGLYKGLNCGRGSYDKKKTVLKNLKLVSKKMKVNNNNLVLMYQTHSNKVTVINKLNCKKKIKSDAIITKMKNIALGVVTADCIPILLFDHKNKIIGCIHAGWKGAFSDIIKNTILKMGKLNSNNKIYASIGPCIGKNSYEVDINFFKKFLTSSKKNKKYFSDKNKSKKYFNLREYAADKLKEVGVIFDHVKYDTFREKNYFFSYRRSVLLKEKDYGRCISVIRML